ncbi:MAG: winged helix-turn-helix domain-containing protein [Candidatus Heimdallarchaeota archaeon]|nr:winged helix-turn-helix domain-containing protein [Candidatus Heimdallarchaeota archaeon]
MSRRRSSLRRSKYEIYNEILSIIYYQSDLPLTRIARAANLPVDRAKPLLRFLQKRNLIYEEEDEGLTVYRIAPNGVEFLELFKRLAKLVPSEDDLEGVNF